MNLKYDVKKRQHREEECLTDFKLHPLHTPSCLGNVNLPLILRIGGNSEDLRRELDGVALGILGL